MSLRRSTELANFSAACSAFLAATSWAFAALPASSLALLMASVFVNPPPLARSSFAFARSSSSFAFAASASSFCFKAASILAPSSFVAKRSFLKRPKKELSSTQYLPSWFAMYASLVPLSGFRFRWAFIPSTSTFR